MSKPTAIFVSAAFASFLAGGGLATVSGVPALAADDCLSGAKGAVPEGSHWYYRIDRATKRHCWYIGDLKEKASRAPRQNTATAAIVDPSPKNAAAPPSIADAHAEMPPPDTRAEQTATVTSPQRAPATVPNELSMANIQQPSGVDANAQRSMFASRWPEPSGMGSSAGPAPAPLATSTNPQSESAAGSTPETSAITLAAADSPPETAALTAAAAGSSPDQQPGSMRMLLVAIVGALGFAGLLASAIFRFGRIRRTGRRKVARDRRAIWDGVGKNGLSPLAYPASVLRWQGTDPSRERRPDDPSARIAEMLAQLSRGRTA
jgi:hypothetical protein